MKRQCVLGLLLFAAASCITVNIYFPAEEVKSAADRIVGEVYGEIEESDSEPEKVSAYPRGTSMTALLASVLAATEAHAEQNIKISTPKIRAVRESLKNRAPELLPYLNNGSIGIGYDGLLQGRNADKMQLKEAAEVNRLVKAENKDRLRLYEEIAKANGFASKADEVKRIFSKEWRSQALPGWYVQDAKGAWKKKAVSSTAK